MSAVLETGRSLTLAGIGFISVTTGWLLVRTCKVSTWPGGPQRWHGRVDPSFRPVERYPSQEAAGLAGGTFLALFGLATYLLVVGFPAFVTHRPLTPRSAAAAALELGSVFLVGLLCAVLGGIGLARLAASMRGVTVFRYPDLVAGVMLGGGLCLTAGGGIAAVGAGLLSLSALMGGPSLAGGRSGGFPRLNGVALALSVLTLLVDLDALRRVSPIIRGMRTNSSLSQGSSPFQAGH